MIQVSVVKVADAVTTATAGAAIAPCTTIDDAASCWLECSVASVGAMELAVNAAKSATHSKQSQAP